MKVIGRMSEYRVLVEASDDEMARVVGVDWVHQAPPRLLSAMGESGWRTGSKGFAIGAEIQVSPMWDWMKKARETFKRIEDTGKLLFGLAEVLAHAPPPALMEPVKIELVEAERPE